ncbi:hypothetical protein DYB31_009817 [Aphanomyces astaci]|uniref:Peptidase C1A papain C-terminal domain-containing protein n=1 Tax=Aphanomyces astaci TaxID=112090 RepID=A0A397EFL7_APHAT|nr:hypothetical protein DYB31_009817 [Aphanomyces astaci]
MKSFPEQNFTSGSPLPELANTRASEVDWSTSKCNSPIANQGQCGSCWAFASIGAVETAHCIATGELLDLSEQQVVSCSKNNNGCNGGNPSIALDWMQQGVCTEDSYPYTSGKGGQTGTCGNSCTKKKLSIGKTKKTSGEKSLMTVLESQPATVFVESNNAVWRNYKGGIVSQCPGAQNDHLVIAVGYGTSKGDYFKIKNSWGTEWGENGYMYLKRGMNNQGVCNVATVISYPELTGSSPNSPHSKPTPSSSHPNPPSSPNQPPSSPDQPPSSPNQPPSSPNQPPFSPNQPPFSPNQPPFSPNQLPFSPNQLPFSPNQLPFSPNKPPFSPNQLPFSPNQPPFSPNEPPYSPDQPPFSPNQPPFPPNEPPSSPSVPKPSNDTPMTPGAPKPSTGPSCTPSSGNGVKDQLMVQTNKIRAAHGISPVTWDDKLEAEMQKWAGGCPGFKHGGPKGSQNLATNIKCSGAACMKVLGASWMWYDEEEKSWNYASNKCNGDWAKCGHFTNMMSPETTSMACGWSECGGDNNVWCNYINPGMNPKVGKITGMTKDELKASLTQYR